MVGENSNALNAESSQAAAIGSTSKPLAKLSRMTSSEPPFSARRSADLDAITRRRVWLCGHALGQVARFQNVFLLKYDSSSAITSSLNSIPTVTSMAPDIPWKLPDQSTSLQANGRCVLSFCCQSSALRW